MINTVYENLGINEDIPEVAGGISIMFDRAIDDRMVAYNYVGFSDNGEYLGLLNSDTFVKKGR